MQKLYYSIGEVSDLIVEEQHILRHWEKTFQVLKPKKNSSGVRVYNSKDIEALKAIKVLLRERLLSTKDAKALLKSRKDVLTVLSPESAESDESLTQGDSGSISTESDDSLQKGSQTLELDTNLESEESNSNNTNDLVADSSLSAAPSTTQVGSEIGEKRDEGIAESESSGTSSNQVDDSFRNELLKVKSVLLDIRQELINISEVQ